MTFCFQSSILLQFRFTGTVIGVLFFQTGESFSKNQRGNLLIYNSRNQHETPLGGQCLASSTAFSAYIMCADFNQMKLNTNEIVKCQGFLFQKLIIFLSNLRILAAAPRLISTVYIALGFKYNFFIWVFIILFTFVNGDRYWHGPKKTSRCICPRSIIAESNTTVTITTSSNCIWSIIQQEQCIWRTTAVWCKGLSELSCAILESFNILCNLWTKIINLRKSGLHIDIVVESM